MKLGKSSKIIICVVLGSLLLGCGKYKRPFGKESDCLVKSACSECQGKPFYVNGHWI